MTTYLVKTSVVDPHDIDADPDADPDSTYHPDAYPDADPYSDFYLMQIRIRLSTLCGSGSRSRS
jgi:hypothetical protein